MTRQTGSPCSKKLSLGAAILIGLFCSVTGCTAATDVPPADMRTPPAKRESPPNQSPAPASSQESVRPPVQPAPVESRTPEEAAKRAADPKDPSGAIVIEPKK